MAASRKTPLQIDTSRAPRACASRTASMTSGDGSPCQPGTITVSAVLERLEPVLDEEPEAARGRRHRAGTLGGDGQLVPPRNVELRPGEAEDLDHDPELERGDPGSEQSDDAMHVARY